MSPPIPKSVSALARASDGPLSYAPIEFGPHSPDSEPRSPPSRPTLKPANAQAQRTPATFHLATTYAHIMLPRMKVWSPLLSLAIGLIGSAATHAQNALTTWVGTTDGLFNTLSNWSGGAPAGSDLVFQGSIRPLITLDAPVSVNSLSFGGIYPAYTFSAANGAILTLGIGGINVAAQAQSPIDFAAVPIQLADSQTWNVDGMLQLSGPISQADNATATLTKTGTGTLTLGGQNTFSGGVDLQQGTLLITAGSVDAGGVIVSGSLGIGALNLSENAVFGASRPGITIANPVSLSTGVVLLTGSNNERERGLTFSGPVTTTTNDMIVYLSGSNPLGFGGLLDGPENTAIRFLSESNDQLDGAVFAGLTTPNVSNLIADRAALYFVSAESLPDTVTVQAVNNGYVGVAAATGFPLLPASALIGRIADPSAFAGTFGFDTQMGSGPPQVNQENLDFRSFTHPSFRIGSATEAVLTGTIAAPINDGEAVYRFGSGGGVLFIQSNLSDTIDPNTEASIATAVEVSSRADEDLSGIVLSGENTFSGTTTVGAISNNFRVSSDTPVTSNLRVDRAMVILDSPRALPADATYSLGELAYIGYTEATEFATFADFLARMSPEGYDANSVFGIDSHAFVEEKRTLGDTVKTNTMRVFSGDIDLSSLNGGFLGTLTGAQIDGTVLAPSGGILQLTGVSEGRLAITSNLSTTTADALPNIDRVVIGHPGQTDADEFAESEVHLTGASTYAGGTTLQNGILVIGNNSTSVEGVVLSGPLGTGTLTVSPSANPVVLASDSPMGATLFNAIDLTGSLQLGRGDALATSSQTATRDPNLLILAGGISGSGGIDVNGHVLLSGSNSYTGGTHAHSGSLIFASTESIPITGTLKSDVAGYIGLNSAPSSPQSLQSDYVDRFDSTSMQGTIGFDTDPNSDTPTEFSDSISLANLTSTSARLGSSTVAKLTGTITPAGTVYRFGGGGGYLEVGSPLTGTTSEVEVSSPHGASLTLRLTGSNDYSGRTNVSNSALIFGAGALPHTSPFSLDPNGYIGSEDTSLDSDFSPFLNRFASNLGSGTIGFDTSPDGAGRIIDTTLDLTRFDSTTPNFHIGTSTSLTFSGNSSILLPTHATAYRFTAYKGGRLQIDTELSGTVGMVIGDPDSLMSQVSPAGITSSVVLNASNTFSGDTTLYAGDVYLGTSTFFEGGLISGPLGTGTLRVEPTRFSNSNLRPALRALGDPVNLDNAIVLNSNLGVGSDITLGGTISGSGGIYKVNAGNLTLAGLNSSWVGGISVNEGTVTFDRNTSAGTGTLRLGDSNATSATFLSAAPTIGSLAGENAANQLILAENSALSITQSGSSRFMGEISGAGASVRVQGFNPNVVNQLTLGGANVYTGGTTIGANSQVVAAHHNALGTTGGVTLNQGSLAVAPGVTLAFSSSTHPLTVNSGQLGGTGTLALDTSLTVNGGPNGQIALSPGFKSPGKLNFNFSQNAKLILDSGGNYQWKLADASNATGGWDSIEVAGGVDIAATDIAPFNLTIASVNPDGSPGEAGNFDIYSSYSWTLLTASTITGFDPAKFSIDGTLFLNRTFDGSFAVALDGTGTSLMLNYTAAAIPEPSTWAMLIIGAGVIAFSSLRSRRRR